MSKPALISAEPKRQPGSPVVASPRSLWTTDRKPSAEEPSTPLLAGARNCWGFAFFNALGYQITLGTPTVLYAKSLGASAAILGALSALTSLLVICQIPATPYLARVGYRKFILAGWGLRTLAVFLIALLPLVGSAGAGAKLALLAAFLFTFNLLRGISVGAWLPWITDLVPGSIRGWFMARQQFCDQAGNLLSILLAAFALRGRGDAHPWQFSALFFLSLGASLVSLLFVSRVPETAPGHETVALPPAAKTSGYANAISWRQIFADTTFRRLFINNALYQLAVGSLPVFSVAFLRDHAAYGESAILCAVALGFLGAMLSVSSLGRLADRRGSKPVLRGALILFALVTASWCALAGGPPVFTPWRAALVPALFFATGVGTANFSVAYQRLVMATIPSAGRNLFFAYYTVLTSLALGISPIFWGLLIDALQGAGGRLAANSYAIYFAALWLVTLLGLTTAGRLRESPGI